MQQGWEQPLLGSVLTSTPAPGAAEGGSINTLAQVLAPAQLLKAEM